MRIIAFTSLALVMAVAAYADVNDPLSPSSMDPMHTEPEEIDTPAPAGPEGSPVGEPAGGPTSTSDTHNVDESEPDTGPSASSNSASQGPGPNEPSEEPSEDHNEVSDAGPDEDTEASTDDAFEDLTLLLVPGIDHNYSPNTEAFTLGDLGVRG